MAVAIGANALSADQTVEESVAVGNDALKSQTSGRNHAFGFRALQDLVSGTYNVAVGGETLENITTGTYNTAVGTFAGRLGLAADFNVFVGYKSGYNTSADGNTFIGYEAGSTATTTNNSVAIGRGAMGNSATTGDFNIAIGRTTMQGMTSGTQNTAIGVDSLSGVSTGNYNVAVGPSSLRLGETTNSVAVGNQSGRNATGNNQVFVGYSAGYNNTSGINTAIGYRALLSNQTGTGNVAVGNDVMYYNNGGSYNVAVGNAANQAGSGHRNVHIGQQAGGYNTGTLITAVGNQAAEGLQDNTNASSFGTFIGAYAGREGNTGQSNTFIGYNAGAAVTTGGNNTFLGSYNGQTGVDLRTSSSNIVLSTGDGTIRSRWDSNGLNYTGATHITSADASNAFLVKTNHTNNPTALQIGGSGAINGVSSSNQSFTILNVAKDSGSGKSAYFHGHVKTDGLFGSTRTSSLGSESVMNILNHDPEDGGTDFDQTPTDNSDGGGTYWSMAGDGNSIYYSSTSGGHGGIWMFIHAPAGYYVIKGSVRLTNTDGAVHGSTPSANYKYTHSFQFYIDSGPNTGSLKWDADGAAAATGTPFVRAAFCSAPVYMADGYRAIKYATNGYNGVQKIYITELQLVRVS
jgi:hypothetical protein